MGISGIRVLSSPDLSLMFLFPNANAAVDQLGQRQLRLWKKRLFTGNAMPLGPLQARKLWCFFHSADPMSRQWLAHAGRPGRALSDFPKICFPIIDPMSDCQAVTCACLACLACLTSGASGASGRHLRETGLNADGLSQGERLRRGISRRHEVGQSGSKWVKVGRRGNEW